MPWSLLLSPTVLLGIAIAAASAFGWLQTTRLGAAQDRIQALRGEYAERDLKIQGEANKRLQAAQERARAAEQRSAEDVAAVSAQFERDRNNVAAHTRKTIADLHTGVLSLRVQLDTRGTQPGDRGPAAEAGPAAGECHGSAGSGFLAAADAAFLVGLAGEADEVVAQLTACQAVVRADRPS